MNNLQSYSKIIKMVESQLDIIAGIKPLSKNMLIFKNNHKKQVISFFFPPTREQLVLKIVYPKGNVVRKFFRSFKKSSCRREYENTTHFFRQGFNVAQPILWGEKRESGRLKKDYYLSQKVDHALSLADYLQQLSVGYNSKKLQEKRHIIKLLGDYIGRLHQHFIYHCDLRCCHILIKQSSGTNSIYLIDCEASRIYPKQNKNIMIWDLRKLRKSTMGYFKQGLITKTDRLRFFKEYCKYNPQVAQNLNSYTSRILELKNEWSNQ